MSDRVIVSRHSAAIEFIARSLGGEVFDAIVKVPNVTRGVSDHHDCYGSNEASIIPIVATASPDDVRGRIAYGNLPLHLAALAAKVYVIEFAGTPPRGQEYTLADMLAAGARLVSYGVLVIPDDTTTSQYLASGGFAL